MGYKNILLSIIAVLILVIIVGGAYWISYQRKSESNTVPIQGVATDQGNTSTPSNSAGSLDATTSTVGSSAMIASTSSWEEIEDDVASSTGLVFSVPNFGAPYRIETSFSQSVSQYTFELALPSSSIYNAEFAVIIYNNSSNLSLHDWFEKNVDDDGVLLAQGGFKQITLSNGSPAYVFVSSAPLVAIEPDGGPGELNDAYTEIDGQIVSINDLDDGGDMNSRGYSQGTMMSLYLQILGTAHSESLL